MAKQCWESRPNPSGQPQEPCSHGPSRPGAARAARRATSGPSLHASNAATSLLQFNGVTHRLQPRPAITAETRTVPACPIPSGETNAGRRPNTTDTNDQTSPPRPKGLKSKHLRRQCPSAAPNQSRPPPGEKSQNPAVRGTFWDISPDQRQEQANGKRRMAEVSVAAASAGAPVAASSVGLTPAAWMLPPSA